MKYYSQLHLKQQFIMIEFYATLLDTTHSDCVEDYFDEVNPVVRRSLTTHLMSAENVKHLILRLERKNNINLWQ